MKDIRFIESARELLADATPVEVLRWASEAFSDPVTLATSLGAEDQVLTHMVAVQRFPISVFMLDTGRLFEETYDLLDETQRQYDLEIRQYFPSSQDVENATNKNGPNFFRNSVALRKECCFIRKVKPLRRALKGNAAWITGLRREQSPTRDGVHVIEWDEGNGIYKINPLWNWTNDDVWDFIKTHDIPYNPLHDKNFPSIGCAPCTRAIVPGEDDRAGRWWWESPETKECGIHIVDGKVVRKRKPQPALVV